MRALPSITTLTRYNKKLLLIAGGLSCLLAHSVQAGSYCDETHSSYGSKSYSSSSAIHKPLVKTQTQSVEEAQFEPLNQPAPRVVVKENPKPVVQSQPAPVKVEKTIVAKTIVAKTEQAPQIAASAPTQVEEVKTQVVGAVESVASEPVLLAENTQTAEPVETVVAVEKTEPNVAALSERLAQGKTIWEGTCQGCHATGAIGAPKIDDQAAWAPRAAKGIDTLISHAISGFNSMPARGGNSSLNDEQVGLAVQYMVSVTHPEAVK